MKSKTGTVKCKITHVPCFRASQRGRSLRPRVGVRGSEASLYRREPKPIRML